MFMENFLRKPDSDEEAFKFGLFNYILAACGAATGYMQLKFNVISNLEVIQTLEEWKWPERTGGLRIYYMTMFLNI